MRLPGAIETLTAFLILSASQASAEFSIIIYIGKSLTNDGDLRLKRGATDLKLEGVSWEDRSFSAPIFYGVRASYWFKEMRDYGVALDFTHAKTILKDEVVHLRGRRDGTAVEGDEPVSNSIDRFELSHGLNMVTFNGLYRWFPAGTRDQSLSGRLQCYTGFGGGFSISHVEGHIKGDSSGWTGRYQFPAGPVVNGMLGVGYDFDRAVTGLLEYKLSYADTHADLDGGGKIHAPTFTNQFVTGLSGNVNPD